jgi:small subunit ribosomal protein S16
LAVRIRLKRAGSRHRPFYKVVVTDSRNPRDGAAIELLGHYDPLADPEEFKVDEERLNHWLSKGASASEPVQAPLRRMKRKKERGEAGMEPLMKESVMGPEQADAKAAEGAAGGSGGEEPAAEAPGEESERK